MAVDRDVDFSVVIPAHNAASTLGEQLAALARQQVDVVWEIVIADNGSSDETKAVAESFRERLPSLRIVDACDDVGAAYARNVGAAAALGGMLLFVDADDVVADGWLAAMVAATRDGAKFVGGSIDYSVLQDRSSSIQPRMPWVSRPARLLDFLPWAFSGNCGVRKEVFEAVGGWDTTFERGEDVAFSWTVQLAGHQLVSVPEAVLHCRLRGDLRGLVRQQVGNGELVPHLLVAFRQFGAAAPPLRRALKRWSRLLTGLPGLAVSRSNRREFIRRAALEYGRIRGCIRWRVWCP